MMGVSDLVEKECRTTMLVGDMDISRLMVFAQQMEESKLNEESFREKKMSRMDDDKSFDDESDGHGRPRFRQKFPWQGPSSTPKFHQKRVNNPKFQDDSCEILLSGCSKCDRRHEGECLAGSNVCFGCGELGHKIRHCPKVARNEEDSRCRSQPYPCSGPIGLGGSAPKKNRF
uniref:Retrotransposon gag protein n=1 Tax=Solanum tuberosum TaxID=4113 RepID=M1DNB1_SOLTU